MCRSRIRAGHPLTPKPRPLRHRLPRPPSAPPPVPSEPPVRPKAARAGVRASRPKPVAEEEDDGKPYQFLEQEQKQKRCPACEATVSLQDERCGVCDTVLKVSAQTDKKVIP